MSKRYWASKDEPMMNDAHETRDCLIFGKDLSSCDSNLTKQENDWCCSKDAAVKQSLGQVDRVLWATCLGLRP